MLAQRLSDWGSLGQQAWRAQPRPTASRHDVAAQGLLQPWDLRSAQELPRTVCPSGLRGWTQVPLAQAAWAQIPQLSGRVERPPGPSGAWLAQGQLSKWDGPCSKPAGLRAHLACAAVPRHPHTCGTENSCPPTKLASTRGTHASARLHPKRTPVQAPAGRRLVSLCSLGTIQGQFARVV